MLPAAQVISTVASQLPEDVGPHAGEHAWFQLYPPREDGTDPRICPKCGTGQLHLKTSRTGGFVGCGNYPECTYTRPIAGEGAEGDERLLGEDDGDEIWLKAGRFGPYVQRGEPTPENKKPPRASLPRGWDKDDMTLDKALTLLSLPREIGEHPDGGMIKSNFGRFGPYIMHQGPEDAKPVYVNVKDPNDVFEIGMNRAVELLAEKRANLRAELRLLQSYYAPSR